MTIKLKKEVLNSTEPGANYLRCVMLAIFEEYLSSNVTAEKFAEQFGNYGTRQLAIWADELPATRDERIIRKPENEDHMERARR